MSKVRKETPSVVAEKEVAEKEPVRALELLKQIKSGELTPGSLEPGSRRQMVVLLVTDGYGNAEIAQILGVSDRTVERDRRAIREANALPRDPGLVSQMAGMLCMEAETAIQRMRKAVRDKQVEASVKVDAEHRCFQVMSELVQRMQGLGYLPVAAQRLAVAGVIGVGVGGDEVPDRAVIERELQRIKEVASETGREAEVAVIETLEQKFQHMDVLQVLEEVKARVEPEGGEDEHRDEPVSADDRS